MLTLENAQDYVATHFADYAFAAPVMGRDEDQNAIATFAEIDQDGNETGSSAIVWEMAPGQLYGEL